MQTVLAVKYTLADPVLETITLEGEETNLDRLCPFDEGIGYNSNSTMTDSRISIMNTGEGLSIVTKAMMSALLVIRIFLRWRSKLAMGEQMNRPE